MALRVKRAEKYGFCAGVRIADRKVKKFARLGGHGAILGQVVHNERVVQEMEDLGVPTVESLDEALAVRAGSDGSDGSAGSNRSAVDEAGDSPTIVFSAHGVSPSMHDQARARGLKILDTTCPFVYDIHDEARAALAEGAHLVFIGDPRHREVIGYTRDLDASRYHVLTSVAEAETIDWGRYPSIKVLYQTTLNAEDFEPVVRFIEERSPAARRADTICYATKENQDAARALAADPEVGLILVVGGKRSANTRHLWEICAEIKPSHWIQGAADLDPAWFAEVATSGGVVGLTAGASTPDYVVAEVETAVATIG
jgi:(E)-4-hydroxy-3-methyl-but-2-enyl pyrophosphate reductase